MDDLFQVLMDDVRMRLVRGYPTQIRESLGRLSEQQIWSRPNEKSNSIGNLVLHICGSTRHFLGRGVGGTDYRRDRPAEFAEEGPIPRSELVRLLDETVSESERVLAAVAPERMLEVNERTGKPFTVASLILRTAHHWGVHVGQIVYATKALSEGSMDELWTKTMK